MPRWPTLTSLGSPLEPDVKMEYATGCTGQVAGAPAGTGRSASSSGVATVYSVSRNESATAGSQMTRPGAATPNASRRRCSGSPGLTGV
jgi:hypothetical protein